jgi:hypothetical protein
MALRRSGESSRVDAGDQVTSARSMEPCSPLALRTAADLGGGWSGEYPTKHHEFRCRFCRDQRARRKRKIAGALVDPTASAPDWKQEPQDPLSNRACRFPAHGLPMVFGDWLATDSVPCLAGGKVPKRGADRWAKTGHGSADAGRRDAITTV